MMRRSMMAAFAAAVPLLAVTSAEAGGWGEGTRHYGPVRCLECPRYYDDDYYYRRRYYRPRVYVYDDYYPRYYDRPYWNRYHYRPYGFYAGGGWGRRGWGVGIGCRSGAQATCVTATALKA